MHNSTRLLSGLHHLRIVTVHSLPTRIKTITPYRAYPLNPRNSFLQQQQQHPPMDHRIKAFIFLLLLSFYSAKVEVCYGVDPAKPLNEVITRKNLRELITFDAMLDYEKAGPNPRHDQGKKPPAAVAEAQTNP